MSVSRWEDIKDSFKGPSLFIVGMPNMLADRKGGWVSTTRSRICPMSKWLQKKERRREKYVDSTVPMGIIRYLHGQHVEEAEEEEWPTDHYASTLGVSEDGKGTMWNADKTMHTEDK